jgi:hypothetical protein
MFGFGRVTELRELHTRRNSSVGFKSGSRDRLFSLRFSWFSSVSPGKCWGSTAARIAVGYATISRRNIRCLVTAGKYISNTRAIAKQVVGKRVPAATYTHETVEILLDYNNRNCFLCGSCRNVISRVNRVPDLIVEGWQFS